MLIILNIDGDTWSKASVLVRSDKLEAIGGLLQRAAQIGVGEIERDPSLAEEAPRRFCAADPWQRSIMQWASDKPEITISEVLSEAIGAEPSKASQMRAAGILRRMGWRKVKHTSRVGWVHP